MQFTYNYIISSNSFSMDTRLERLSRLKMIADHIEMYASEVSLSQESLDWAMNAWKVFENLLETKYKDLDEKNSISQISLRADSALYERYVIIKDLFLSELTANTEQNSQLIKRLGLDGSIPYKKDERIQKAFQLIETYEEIINEGVKISIPSLMIENLKHLTIDAKQKLDLVVNERLDAMHLTNDLNNHFENDNIKLRQLYKWIVAFWGKKDPRLFDLGFTPLKIYVTDASVDKIESLKYDKKAKKFTWEGDKYAHIYQLAKRIDHNGREWIEIYSGTENSFNYVIQDDVKQFKVRGKNDYGFGEWSEILELK